MFLTNIYVTNVMFLAFLQSFASHFFFIYQITALFRP